MYGKLLKPPTIISNHLVFKFFRPRSVTHIYLWGHVPIIRIFFRRNYLACGKIILPKPGCRLILWRHSFPCNLAPRTAARLALSGPLHMHVWIGSGFKGLCQIISNNFLFVSSWKWSIVCFFMKMIHCLFFIKMVQCLFFYENGPLFFMKMVHCLFFMKMIHCLFFHENGPLFFSWKSSIVCFFMKMIHCFFHENGPLFVFRENDLLFDFSWKWSIVCFFMKMVNCLFFHENGQLFVFSWKWSIVCFFMKMVNCFFMKMVHCFFMKMVHCLIFHENGPLFVFSWKWSIVFSWKWSIVWFFMKMVHCLFFMKMFHCFFMKMVHCLIFHENGPLFDFSWKWSIVWFFMKMVHCLFFHENVPVLHSTAGERGVWITEGSGSSLYSVAYPGILFRGVKQIQLRTEDRENGDLGAVAP